MKHLLAIIITFTSLKAYSHEHKVSLDSHQHGSATLEISAEKNKIEINFDAPAETILGFEHAPVTKEEKDIYERARKLWHEEVLTKLIIIPSEYGCTIHKFKFEQDMKEKLTAHDKQYGTHSEMEIEVDFKCQKSAVGTQVVSHVKKHFPRINTLKIESVGSKINSVSSTKETVTIQL